MSSLKLLHSLCSRLLVLLKLQQSVLHVFLRHDVIPIKHARRTVARDLHRSVLIDARFDQVLRC